jgi:hypothetical protein
MTCLFPLSSNLGSSVLDMFGRIFRFSCKYLSMPQTCQSGRVRQDLLAGVVRAEGPAVHPAQSNALGRVYRSSGCLRANGPTVRRTVGPLGRRVRGVDLAPQGVALVVTHKSRRFRPGGTTETCRKMSRSRVPPGRKALQLPMSPAVNCWATSPLKKGTGTSRLPFFAGKFACPFGASPLFQRAATIKTSLRDKRYH